MSTIIIFIQKAIAQGIAILYGANGEILTEKSGNLNLGVPGMMYMGGIAGLVSAFLYERAVADPVPLVGFVIALVSAFLCAALGGLIYSVLTISLRANQNVTGLALTTFGVGIGNFFGGSLSQLAGGVGQISVSNTASAFTAKIPLLSDIPVIGDIFFSYGVLTYLSIIISLLLAWYMSRTRNGLNLRAVGESPATADAAGINVTKFKYLATCIGGVLRRHLDQQRLRRPRLAGNSAGNLCPLEAGTRHLGIHTLWRSLYSVSLHFRSQPRMAGDFQDAAICGNDPGSYSYQSAQKARKPAPGQPWHCVFPRGALMPNSRMVSAT